MTIEQTIRVVQMAYPQARRARAIRDTSVLETRRLQRAVDGVSPRDLSAIAAGMSRLAAACRAIADEKDSAAPHRPAARA